MYLVQPAKKIGEPMMCEFLVKSSNPHRTVAVIARIFTSGQCILKIVIKG